MPLRFKIAILLLVVWIGCSVFAFYGFFLSHYGVFDEHREWNQHTALVIQGSENVSLQWSTNAQWQAVLISDKSCSCSSYAKEHLQRMRQRQASLETRELELADAGSLEQSLQLKIVATPMLLLFQNQKLMYAGPLATDLMCSDNSSILDGIINGTSQLPGVWLNGESSACRCTN